jgi:hypothetical protein
VDLALDRLLRLLLLLLRRGLVLLLWLHLVMLLVLLCWHLVLLLMLLLGKCLQLRWCLWLQWLQWLRWSLLRQCHCGVLHFLRTELLRLLNARRWLLLLLLLRQTRKRL